MNENDVSYNHSAYVKFINELPQSTYQEINFIVINLGHKLGLTQISDLDVDSTVKEGNITYPTDAKNLKTQMLMIYECLKYFNINGYSSVVAFSLQFNLTKALRDFKKYFFEKNKDKKMSILQALAKRINILIENALAAFEKINMSNIKWYILRKLEKIQKYAKIYIKQVQHFCRTGSACKNKILSFHIDNVAAIQKGKEHKKYEFGEVWQVGRLDGNFCFGMFHENDLRYNDSTAIEDVVEKVMTNTDSILKSITADRAYWSDENLEAASAVGICEQGLHPKGRKPWPITDTERVGELINRRAGIEPLIGHLKRLGLGKSRMKTVVGTRAEGARSFIAFNIQKILSVLA
jgi:transposase, IS5 family